MNKLRRKYKNPVFSGKEETEFRATRKCWICKKDYTTESVPVRDHCHLTGKYRGSACTGCN